MPGAVVQGRHRDDGRADLLRGIDNLFDAGYAQRDVHGCHASKVECLERHLRARLADALGSEGAHSGPCRPGGHRNSRCKSAPLPTLS